MRNTTAPDLLRTNEPRHAIRERLLQLRRELERERRETRNNNTGTLQSVPTSYAQERLWLIDTLEGGGAAYHIPLILTFKGALDVAALRGALDGLVERHQALRTVFVTAEGQPHQKILPAAPFPLSVISLTEHPHLTALRELQAQKLEEASTPFDLNKGPLFRGRLVEVSEGEHVLLLTLHHIVFDGWSMEVLLRELASLYAANLEGRPSPLPPLPLQYADYAVRQRQWLQTGVLKQQLAYWRTQLEGAPAHLDLPTDHPRPAVRTYRGENIPVAIDQQTTLALKTLAQSHDMTLAMVLHASWAILLSALSGQEDLLVGTPIANRQRSELEGLIGFFVNTLALRTQVSRDSTVKALLAQVKEATLAAYEHQDVPFEHVVEAVQPERETGQNPLFQVMLAVQNAPTSDLNWPGLTVTCELTPETSAKFDLFLHLEELGGGLHGYLNFAVDLFTRETAERWVACFMVLLRSITQRTSIRVGDLSYLPESDRETLASFNATQTPLPPTALVHELFEEAAKHPHSIAVVHGHEHLTYG